MFLRFRFEPFHGSKLRGWMLPLQLAPPPRSHGPSQIGPALRSTAAGLFGGMGRRAPAPFGIQSRPVFFVSGAVHDEEVAFLARSRFLFGLRISERAILVFFRRGRASAGATRTSP